MLEIYRLLLVCLCVCVSAGYFVTDISGVGDVGQLNLAGPRWLAGHLAFW